MSERWVVIEITAARHRPGRCSARAVCASQSNAAGEPHRAVVRTHGSNALSRRRCGSVGRRVRAHEWWYVARGQPTLKFSFARPSPPRHRVDHHDAEPRASSDSTSCRIAMRLPSRRSCAGHSARCSSPVDIALDAALALSKVRDSTCPAPGRPVRPADGHDDALRVALQVLEHGRMGALTILGRTFTRLSRMPGTAWQSGCLPETAQARSWSARSSREQRLSM